MGGAGAAGAGLGAGAAGAAGAGTAAGLGAGAAGAGTAAGLGAGAAGAGSALMPVITGAGTTAMGPALEAVLASGAAPAGGGMFASMLPMMQDFGVDLAKSTALQSIGQLTGGKQPGASSPSFDVQSQTTPASPYRPPPIPDISAILQLLQRGIYPSDQPGSGRQS